MTDLQTARARILHLRGPAFLARVEALTARNDAERTSNLQAALATLEGPETEHPDQWLADLLAWGGVALLLLTGFAALVLILWSV